MFSIQLEPSACANQPQGTDGSSQSGDNAAQGGQSLFARLFQQLHPATAPNLASPEESQLTHQNNAERQIVAASKDASDPMGALVSWTISPQLQVITPAAETPSAGSLQAFAKAQGLDEETVQWLFTQTPPSNHTVAGDTLNTHSANDTTLIDANASSAGLTPANVTPANLTPANLTPANTTPANLTPANLTPANTTTFEVVPTILADKVPSASELEPEPLRQAAQIAAGLSPTTTNPANGGAYNVLLGNAGLLTSSDKPSTSMAQPIQPVAQTQVHVPLPPAPSPLAFGAGQSVGLKIMSEASAPAPVNSVEPSHNEQTLAAMAMAVSIRPQVMRTAGAKIGTDGLRNPDTPQEALVLTIDLEDLPSSANTEPEGPHQPASSPLGQPGFVATGDNLARRGLALSAAGTGNAESLLDADPWAQSDKINALSQRLGEAIGERLVAAMERGQWQLKLMLKPAHLGHIEVDMRMRNGELDASFMASQALTRDLLQDGMGRLKAALNDLGMDVAFMEVGDGQNRRFGENPTPDQRPRPTEGILVKDNNLQASTQAVTRRYKNDADGLDVMV